MIKNNQVNLSLNENNSWSFGSCVEVKVETWFANLRTSNERMLIDRNTDKQNDCLYIHIKVSININSNGTKTAMIIPMNILLQAITFE